MHSVWLVPCDGGLIDIIDVYIMYIAKGLDLDLDSMELIFISSKMHV